MFEGVNPTDDRNLVLSDEESVEGVNSTSVRNISLPDGVSV